jgi:type II secretory pathway component PulF
MPTFQYSAIDGSGNRTQGTLYAASLDVALGQLSRDGMNVEAISVMTSQADPLTQAPPPVVHEVPTHERTYMQTNVVGRVVDKVPLSKLMFFFRQFATMQRAGVPIVQALGTLAGQARDGKLNSILRECQGHVEAGRPVSFGLQRYPEVFTPLMVSLIRSGEEGGYLDRASDLVANYIQQDIQIRDEYRRATLMPKLTIGASIFIILCANAFIASQGSNIRIWSPLTQPITWLYLGPIIIGLWLFFKIGLANPAIKARWDQFIINVPYSGHTLHQFAMAKFGRALGALYSGGVPIQRSIELAADSCGNEYVRALIYPAARKLQEGEGIAATLQATGGLTPIVADMLATGERTGNVDEMLTKVAEYYEEEAKVRALVLARIVGVVAIICVAIYVLIVLIKFYTGYFQMQFDAADNATMIWTLR